MHYNALVKAEITSHINLLQMEQMELTCVEHPICTKIEKFAAYDCAKKDLCKAYRETLSLDNIKHAS